MEQHEKICIYRPLECRHCNMPIEFSKMEEHVAESCPMLPVKCPKCEMEIKKGDTELHKKNSCLEEVAPCQYADFGCGAKVGVSTSSVTC